MRAAFGMGLAVALLWQGAALAQSSLSDQINAVSAAQDRQQAAARAAQDAYQRQVDQQRAAEAAAQREHERTAAAAQARHDQEIAAARARDHAYQDQLRQLEVQRQQLELQKQQLQMQGEQAQVDMQRARTARANDYIDQELKAKAAQTDVTQSEADSNRNISGGVKTLMEKNGEAAVRKETGIFNH